GGAPLAFAPGGPFSYGFGAGIRGPCGGGVPVGRAGPTTPGPPPPGAGPASSTQRDGLPSGSGLLVRRKNVGANPAVDSCGGHTRRRGLSSIDTSPRPRMTCSSTESTLPAAFLPPGATTTRRRRTGPLLSLNW